MDEDLVIVRQRGGGREQKRAAWGRLLQRWRESGLDACEFARLHGIPPQRLFTWGAKPSVDAGPVIADGAGSRFIELVTTTTEPGVAPLEIHLHDLRIVLRGGCDAELLRMALAVAREAAC